MRRPGRDNDRWLDDKSLDRSWDERSALMARSIQAGSRVADVGAGAQSLRSALPPNCTYIPVDIVQRSLDTVVCDFNREEPPELFADYVIASGLLEYINNVSQIIKWMASTAPNVVLSYESADGQTSDYRRKSGWVNHHTGEEIREMLSDARLTVVDMAGWRRQTIYWLTSLA